MGISGHLYPISAVHSLGIPEYSTETLIAKHCCSRSVVTCFRKLSQVDIDTVRESFYSLETETAQNQVVLNYFGQHSSCGSAVLYTVAGKTVCESCWRLVYGLRFNKFSSLKQKFAAGVVHVEHGRQGLLQPRDRTLRATSWLRVFVDKVGDRMPMRSALHLPSCLTKADVYGLACDDLTQGDMQCCSISTFYDVWLKEFPHVHIPKVHTYLPILLTCPNSDTLLIVLQPLTVCMLGMCLRAVLFVCNYNPEAFHLMYGLNTPGESIFDV